jgi:hypothetical protein
MKQSHSSEEDSRSAVEEIRHLPMMAYYLAHNSPPLILTLNQFDAVPVLINFNMTR